MKYQTPALKSAGIASNMIQVKNISGGDRTNPLFHSMALDILLEA